jgi:hypothetical protein
MKDPVEVIEYRHHKIIVMYDQDHGNPRENFDYLGTMICFHKRYSLGDKHELTIDQAKAFMRSNGIIQLPLYLYDHSGLAMRTYPFDCPWDSGQVGFVYVALDKVRLEFGWKRITRKRRTQIIRQLASEVEEYNYHLTGQVFGYEIETDTGDFVDSCWGFYGPYDHYMVPEAKRAIDHRTKEQEGLIYE